MTRAKLIVLNGFAAAGKTTIANKYIAEHSLALALEADMFVDHMSDWTNHRDEARQLTFALTKAVLRTYLQSGHDVVLPYLVAEAEEAQEFESIARECDANYYEFVLYNERAEAVARLLERGKWGGATSPPLTDKDLPEIEELMDRAESALAKRPGAIQIQLKGQDPDATYSQVLRRVEP